MTQTETRKTAFLERLKRGDVVVSDGATGTYLQARGLEPGGCPEELNASQPELVRRMSADYYNAGSEISLTNSFGGSKFILKKYGHGDRVRELNRLAASHARSVASRGHYVFGSVGPTGEFLEPLGAVSESEMYDSFTEQVKALEEGGADGVCIETMTALEEASLAVKAAKENTQLAVITTMTFDKGARGWFTMMGVTPERAVKHLRDVGADVVGANCGNGVEAMIELSGIMRKATDGYLIVHSNAGIPAIRKGQIVYPETPEWMAQKLIQIAEIGTNIVGGCCGTTPRHIQAFCDAIRAKEEGR
ncbi:MAG: methionine synthase [SAR202 cluster bacterium]|nr:methionine synthase [SAR202 cluster bacterium]